MDLMNTHMMWIRRIVLLNLSHCLEVLLQLGFRCGTIEELLGSWGSIVLMLLLGLRKLLFGYWILLLLHWLLMLLLDIRSCSSCCCVLGANTLRSVMGSN